MKMGDKVCIGIVNNGSINSQLVIDLIAIARESRSRFDSIIQVNNIGLTTKSRNVVVLSYLKQTEAEWLLLVDADEQLTLEAFHKLCDAAHDKERKVVSGLVFAQFGDDTNGLRPVPTIYRQIEGAGLQAMDDYPLDSVIPISASGTGCLLIHRSVLEAMRENASPNMGTQWCWFFEGAIDGTYFGEDILFSKRLGAMGVQMYAHTGAILKHSKQFWLDERQHAAFREAALQVSQPSQ
jgi:hypothetical protein